MVMLAVAALRAADPDTTTYAHVRSSSARLQGAIEEGKLGSRTFRRLIETIGATNGIVYVEEGVCRHGVRSCLSLRVTTTAGVRYLRVLIDLRAATVTGAVALIGTIGHELCHALEVLKEPSLTTATAVFLFYLREVANWNGGAFETAAAISTEVRVFGEASTARRVGDARSQP